MSRKGLPDFRGDIIAVWRRKADGWEIHLRRDGVIFFCHPSTNQWLRAYPELMTMHQVELWIETDDGKGFLRENGF